MAGREMEKLEKAFLLHLSLKVDLLIMIFTVSDLTF